MVVLDHVFWMYVFVVDVDEVSQTGWHRNTKLAPRYDFHGLRRIALAFVFLQHALNAKNHPSEFLENAEDNTENVEETFSKSVPTNELDGRKWSDCHG